MKAEKIKLSCELDVSTFLETIVQMMQVLFSDMNLHTATAEDLTQPPDLDAFVKKKCEHINLWVRQVLARAVKINGTEAFDEVPIAPLHLPLHLSKIIILALIRIFGEETHLADNGLLFINEVGLALGLEAPLIDTLIEQIQYERRHTFTKMLMETLNEEQRYWVALMLWQAIHIDGVVHPREYKYFENIAQLVNYDQLRIRQLEADIKKMSIIPQQDFDESIRASIYRYIVEIVMIDEEYAPAEAKFIQAVGHGFGYDRHAQDQIIQPVASALMLRRSLFAY